MSSWQPLFAGRVLVLMGTSILLGSLFMTWFVLEPTGLASLIVDQPSQSFSGWELFTRADIAVAALAAAALSVLAAGMKLTRRAIPVAVLALTAVAAGAVGGYALEDVDPGERGLYVGAIAALLSLVGAMVLNAASSIATRPPRRAIIASVLIPLGVALAFASLFLPWYDGPTARSEIPREYFGWEIFSRTDIAIALVAAIAVGVWAANVARRNGVIGAQSLVVLVGATGVVFGAIGRIALEAASLGAVLGVYAGAAGGLAALAGAVLMIDGARPRELSAQGSREVRSADALMAPPPS